MSPHLRAALAAAATGILGGASMVSTKVVSSDASPATLAFLRYAIGIFVFLVPILMARRIRFSLVDTCKIAVLGVFQFAVLMLFLNYALARLPASTCALVMATMPLFTLCFAILARKESFNVPKALGVSIAVLGVAYLLGGPATPMENKEASLLGYGALFGATLTGAISSLMYGPYLRRYGALPTCTLAMGSAVLFLMGFCALIGDPWVPALTGIQWANVVFIGFSSGAGYFCWLWALAKIDASRVVAFQALAPVTAAVMELLIEPHIPSLQLIVSLLAVGGGLFLAMNERAWRRR